MLNVMRLARTVTAAALAALLLLSAGAAPAAARQQATRLGSSPNPRSSCCVPARNSRSA
jgi:uncharacterized membrane protein